MHQSQSLAEKPPLGICIRSVACTAATVDAARFAAGNVGYGTFTRVAVTVAMVLAGEIHSTDISVVSRQLVLLLRSLGAAAALGVCCCINFSDINWWRLPHGYCWTLVQTLLQQLRMAEQQQGRDVHVA
jgi:hypothetical protein